MTFPKELITVTTVSKSLAMFLFIAVPFVGFLVGLKYQQQFTQYFESRASVDQYLLKNQPAATQSASTASPPPNGDRANWKTYRNTKLGFSFKHPDEENWQNPEENLLSTTTSLGFPIFFLNIGVFYDQNKQRELTYLEEIENYSQGRIQPKLITIDGRPAAYLKIHGEDVKRVTPLSNPINVVAIQNGEIIFLFYQTLSNDLSIQEKEQKTFDQILSTFKFTDQ